MGDPFTDVEQGPQIDADQFKKILGYIDSGKEQGFMPATPVCPMTDVGFALLGADLVCGGNRLGNKGYYIEPTVFANVQDEMKIAREEIFGPVQSILKFRDTDDVFIPVISISIKWQMSFQVIRRANDTPYGLAAGILCNDINTVNRVSRSLRAGEPISHTKACTTYHHAIQERCGLIPTITLSMPCRSAVSK